MAINQSLHACVYRSCVRVVTSDRPGMGKSFYIQQMAETLKASQGRESSKYTIIPIHGPEASPDTVMKFLYNHMDHRSCSLYHIDIASDVRDLSCKQIIVYWFVCSVN